MIETPQIGAQYFYNAKGGFGNRRVPVKVTGFTRALVITEGVEDKRRRDVSRKRLEN